MLTTQEMRKEYPSKIYEIILDFFRILTTSWYKQNNKQLVKIEETFFEIKKDGELTPYEGTLENLKKEKWEVERIMYFTCPINGAYPLTRIGELAFEVNKKFIFYKSNPLIKIDEKDMKSQYIKTGLEIEIIMIKKENKMYIIPIQN
jgi:hypothetical protein